MLVHRVEPEKGFGLSSHTSHIIDLQKLISASPSVASLLPHLMRVLADEIEREACARPVPPDHTPATDLHRPLDHILIDPLEAESVAHQVASDLSMALSHHLAR